MQIGIDTSVIIGLLDSQDLWHTPAISLQEAITVAQLKPVYFDCALAEAMSTIARRLREKGREGELTGILDRLLTDFPMDTITWILPDVPLLYSQVVELIQSSNGELNFNDGLMALACRERSILAFASFDRDFDTISWLTRLAESKDIETVLALREDLPPDEHEIK